MSISAGLEAVAHNIASIGALIASIGALLNSRKASKELQPNHGSSQRDTVEGIAKGMAALTSDVRGLRQDIADERHERQEQAKRAQEDRSRLWTHVNALNEQSRRRRSHHRRKQ